MNPVDDDANYRFGIFYYNPDDPRTIVPKRLRMRGYTMNFARPVSYLVLVIILALLVWLVYVLGNSSEPESFNT